MAAADQGHSLQRYAEFLRQSAKATGVAVAETALLLRALGLARAESWVWLGFRAACVTESGVCGLSRRSYAGP